MIKGDRVKKPKPNKLNQNEKKTQNKIVSKKTKTKQNSECTLDAHYYLQQMSAQAQGLLIVAQRWFC